MCLSYSCLNELSQFFIPMRFPSPGDLIMNLAGVCLGLLFHQFMNKYLASQPSI
jgi:VanZ family protein